ncbi:hypothetical protein Poly30_13880 [Planctomycetes bacterium Poly30]|uniref:Lipid/polyisoprenoid-binding YceI-like domain-containing protein n=1 Tax=Saltatorellus ferox TaxID=2528018 RepID=A0A518EP81_9BACT|nr:hypothetical protein Poly30_13880 [Planctomycetes bacterium Poly30]
MSKLLKIVGAFALFAWTAGGIAAWVATKDHVQVTLAEGKAEPGALDPVALLSDQVSTLQSDLRGLASALSENMGLMAQGMEGRSDEQAQALEALRAEVALVRAESSAAALPAAAMAAQDLGPITERLARVEQLMERVLTTSADAAERSRLAEEFAEAEAGRLAKEAQAKIEAAEAQAALSLAREQAVEEATAQAEAAAQALLGSTDTAAPAARKKGGFLSFKLPSDDFTFDKRQRFTVLGNLSRVGFDAKSTLHDFSGVSQSISGQFDVNLAQPGSGIEGELKVESKSLDTALAGRDEAMHDLMEADVYPTIDFVPTSFQADTVNAAEQKVTGKVSGKMTIHGIEKPVVMTVTGTIDESRRLVLEGETTLVMSDFEVKPPSKLGMISVEDDIRLWIALRARASDVPATTGN